MTREVLVGRREIYWAGVPVLGALFVWLWQMPTFAFPFWGNAPLFALAVGNNMMPPEPMSVYLLLGNSFSVLFGVESGLLMLNFIGALVGLIGLMYVVLQLTQDRVQVFVCAGLFALFPVVMRQAVVQESGGVAVGLVVASLAVFLSNRSHGSKISGALFGAAVGVQASVMWMLPGFWFLMRKEESELKKWATWTAGLAVVGWVWAMLQAQANGISGLGYLLGGVGVDAFGPSVWLSAIVVHVDLFARLFGWGGFFLGGVGFVLMAFQDRDRFLFLLLLCGPFLLYRMLNVALADDAVYLAVFGFVFALSAGTAWRVGSRYLAEGLQETVHLMLWVVGFAMIVVQVVCVFYTQNVWADALARRMVYADKIEVFQTLADEVQTHTQPKDLMVVISDAKRLGVLGLVPSSGALMWHLQRQIVFGTHGSSGLTFSSKELLGEDISKGKGLEVDDVFISKALRSDRRLFSFDPFPFLHTSQVKAWLSAIPAENIDGMFALHLGQWPPVEDPEVVANALQKAFEIYVSRGYTTDAAACLQGVVAYQPTDVTHLRKLGDLYMKMGVFQSAGVIYAKLLDLEPSVEEVAVNLSGAYYSMEKLDEAIKVCEDFLIAHPFSPEILFNLAGYYRLADRADEARELYKLYAQMGDTAHRKDEAFRILRELELP